MKKIIYEKPFVIFTEILHKIITGFAKYRDLYDDTSIQYSYSKKISKNLAQKMYMFHSFANLTLKIAEITALDIYFYEIYDNAGKEKRNDSPGANSASKVGRPSLS